MRRPNLIDISVTIREGAVVYPGDAPLVHRPVSRIGSESASSVTRLDWCTHFLTHVDPPSHFIADGETLDEVNLNRYCGESLVVEVEGPSIRPEHLPGGDLNGLNLLFKTRNSFAWDATEFNPDHVYVSGEAAQEMVARGVNLVGIDYLSVEKYGDWGFPAHYALLGNGVVILEGIDLSKVEPGRYFLYALPLKIAQGDGSPVRAVLIAL